MLDTRIGSLNPALFKSNNPPNPPISPVEPFIAVDLAIGDIFETKSSPLLISTPASL